MIRKLISRLVYSGILILLTCNIIAQQPITLKLIDSETQAPISFAHYLSGNQKGVTDESGRLSLNCTDNCELQISHVIYGHIHISKAMLKEAVSTGTLFLTQQENTLQPAIVVGLHHSVQPDKAVKVSPHDMLSHDAGAFLEQNASISTIKKSGNYGFDPVLRGFKYDQLNIVVDGGQSASAACPNRMDPPASQVSLNMMERVEILKGPHALRYGNAFGGTINFISATPEFSEKVSPLARATSSYESNGDIFRIEAMAGASQKVANIQLFGSNSSGSDYKDGEGGTIPGTFKRSSFGLKTDFKLSNSQILSVTATNNIARDVDFPSLPMDLRSDNTWLLDAMHELKIENKALSQVKTSVYASLVDHEMDNLSKNLNPRMVNAITTANTKNYGGRSEARINYNRGWIYTGVDLRIVEQSGVRSREFLMGPMAGNTVYDNVWQDSRMLQYGAFAELHLNVSGYHIIGALRADANNSELKDPADEFLDVTESSSKNYLNISSSLGLTRNLGNTSSIGLWMGRAQRSGSLTELYMNYFPVGLDAYEMLGNPNLKPEVNNQADINFKWFPDNTVIDFTLFGSYLNNYISSVIRPDLTPRMPSSPGVRQYTNIEKALMTGFEASWQQNLPLSLSSEVAVAYTFAKDLSTSNPLPEIPPLEARLSLVGSYFKSKLKPMISFRSVAEQNRISNDFGETSTPSFSLLDIKVFYQLLKQVELSAGIDNVFNTAYYEHLSRAMKIENGKPLYSPGRNYFVTVSFKL